jgi:beta-lactamase superfamily II metal-dependent hydrolase
MATKKATKKTAKKKAGTKKAAKRSSKAAPPKKATKKAAKKANPAKRAAKSAKSPAKAGGGGGGGRTKGALRVRMYRVGFGDFFLLTVPTKTGPQHILIDCGVHAGDIKSMKDCVQDLAQETDRKLALVIATHYHADHLSGFATNFDEFAQFEVGMVWITNRLDPKNEGAAKFKAQITSLAGQLQLRLGARRDDAGKQAADKVQNALGIQLGAKEKEGGNEKALRLLTEGFKNKPPVRYYQGNDTPEFPKALKGAITAELLAPAPIDSGKEFASSDNKKEQYLGAAADEGLPSSKDLKPFEKEWPAGAGDYPPEVFLPYRTAEQLERNRPGSPKTLEKLIQAAQPDVLLAMAEAVDGTLNNQSLVVLFTCRGKKLLFVGDAQWGNWSYWLYGKKITGDDPGINKKAKDILGSIDFFKVGHHGSTNANPIPAVAALNQQCVSMCSTESGDPDGKRPYGNVEKETEVPRIKLMEEMEKQTKNRLVRSDWIKVLNVHASPEAKKQLAKLPANFSTGDLYVDYIFPK